MITLFIGEEQACLETDCREYASKRLQIVKRYLETGEISYSYNYLEENLDGVEPSDQVTVGRLCQGNHIPEKDYKDIGFVADFIYNTLHAMRTEDFKPLAGMLSWYEGSYRGDYHSQHLSQTKYLLNGYKKHWGEVDIPYHFLNNRALTSSLMVLPRCANTLYRLSQEGARLKITNMGECEEGSTFFSIMRRWMLPRCNMYKYGNYGLAGIVYLLSHWVDATYPQFYNTTRAYYKEDKQPQPELAEGIEHCLRLMRDYNGPNNALAYLTRDYPHSIPEKLREDLTRFVSTDMGCLYLSRLYYSEV
jgi:hypothetical protein